MLCLGGGGEGRDRAMGRAETARAFGSHDSVSTDTEHSYQVPQCPQQEGIWLYCAVRCFDREEEPTAECALQCL